MTTTTPTREALAAALASYGTFDQDDATYNGWPNRPTWAAVNWLTSYDPRDASREAPAMLAARAAQAVNDADTLAEAARALADAMTDAAPDAAGLFGELLGWAVGVVDWRRVAAALASDDTATRWQELDATR